MFGVVGLECFSEIVNCCMRGDLGSTFMVGVMISLGFFGDEMGLSVIPFLIGEARSLLSMKKRKNKLYYELSMPIFEQDLSLTKTQISYDPTTKTTSTC